MKKTANYLAAFGLTLLVAASASAQGWKGMGRLQGSIVDPSGKAIEGAKVVLKSTRANNTGPDPIVTDAKGRWAALGLMGGTWSLDVTAEGYLPLAKSIEVSEINRMPPMKLTLEAAPPPEPIKEEAPAVETVQVGGVEVSPEIAQALEAANGYMKEEKWKEAAVEYEKALAVLSTSTSLRFALSRAYYGAGDLDKAIEQLQTVYAADTGNMTAATLLADMLLEKGRVDEGKKVLAAMPPGAMLDPNTIINLGIRFMNNNLPQDAHKYFSDAVSAAPDMAAAYYYRGIASLQLKKMNEARADFKKVIAMAPDSSEAKDAKELLDQMK